MERPRQEKTKAEEWRALRRGGCLRGEKSRERMLGLLKGKPGPNDWAPAFPPVTLFGRSVILASAV